MRLRLPRFSPLHNWTPFWRTPRRSRRNRLRKYGAPSRLLQSQLPGSQFQSSPSKRCSSASNSARSEASHRNGRGVGDIIRNGEQFGSSNVTYGSIEHVRRYPVRTPFLTFSLLAEREENIVLYPGLGTGMGAGLEDAEEGSLRGDGRGGELSISLASFMVNWWLRRAERVA